MVPIVTVLYYGINPIYPTPLLGQDMTQGQFFFKVEFNRFEFRVFLLLD